MFLASPLAKPSCPTAQLTLGDSIMARAPTADPCLERCWLAASMLEMHLHFEVHWQTHRLSQQCALLDRIKLRMGRGSSDGQRVGAS